MTVDTRQHIKCVIADWLAAVVAILLFNICRYEWFTDSIGWTLRQFLTCKTILTGWAIFPLFILFIYYLSGAYYNTSKRSRLNELVNTFITNAIAAIIIYFTILVDDIVEDKATIYEMIGSLWLILTILVGGERLYLSTRLIRRVRAGHLGYNTLIVGVTQAAVNMVDKITNSSHAHGFNIVGYINPNVEPPVSDNLRHPIYQIDDIEKVIKEHNVVNLIVMPHRDGMHATVRLLNRLFPLGLSMFISPVLMRVISGKSSFDNVRGEPLIDVSQPDISPSTASCKRAADIACSAGALLLLSPLLLAIGIAIKIKSPQGNILFYQDRVGYRKKHFNIIKFRTMYPDAEDSGPALSSPDDPRITPIGRFLRKYRLDELPQFWNVLKGEMSIVGPRPEREYYIKRIVEQVPYYSLIHNVRPGITSWGMVKYGYATTVEEMIERLQYDLVYIENISFGVDLKIILYTVRTVMTGKGI